MVKAWEAQTKGVGFLSRILSFKAALSINSQASVISLYPLLWGISLVLGLGKRWWDKRIRKGISSTDVEFSKAELLTEEQAEDAATRVTDMRSPNSCR